MVRFDPKRLFTLPERRLVRDPDRTKFPRPRLDSERPRGLPRPKRPSMLVPLKALKPPLRDLARVRLPRERERDMRGLEREREFDCDLGLGAMLLYELVRCSGRRGPRERLRVVPRRDAMLSCELERRMACRSTKSAFIVATSDKLLDRCNCLDPPASNKVLPTARRSCNRDVILFRFSL